MVEQTIIELNLSPITVVVLILVLCSYSGEAQSAIQPASPLTFGTYPTSVWDVSSVCVIIGSLIATLLLVLVLLILLRHFTTLHSNYVTESNNKCESFNGIHPQLLQTFPILCYSSITNLKEEPLQQLQCAVCLAEFNGGDTLRLLPQCNHVFHPPCIDAWLSTHVTCPVCRANLNHHHYSLNFATISGDADTSGGCGSEEEGEEEKDKGEREHAKLIRSNSTGHSVVEGVKKSIMQRSASCNLICEEEELQPERLVLASVGLTLRTGSSSCHVEKFLDARWKQK